MRVILWMLVFTGFMWAILGLKNSLDQDKLSKELSKGKAVGYAYLTKSIQPAGYTAELAYIEEDNLKRVLGYPSTHKQQIIDSYNIYA